MKKAKQIIAIIGIAVLVAMYVITFIFSLIDHPDFMKLVGVSAACTVLIPVILWAGLRLFGPRNNDEQ